MLNLYPYHLMVNSIYTSGFKHPCSVGVGGGGKKKKETCSTKGSCQTIHYKCFISIYEYFFMRLNTRCKVIFYSVLHPLQDYLSSCETGQSVGGAKTGEPREKNT